MTDKEQIIIDGIQFNEFGDFYVDYDFNGKFQSISSSSKEYKILKSLIEQLARKTQEYEQKEKELLSNEKIINKLMKEVDELKQECDTLKSQLDFAVQQKECFEQECERYEHLFNELDKRVSNSTKIFDCIVVSKIVKDIINKVKDKICYWDKSIDMSKATLQVDGEIICKFDNDNQTVILVNDNYLNKAKDGK